MSVNFVSESRRKEVMLNAVKQVFYFFFLIPNMITFSETIKYCPDFIFCLVNIYLERLIGIDCLCAFSFFLTCSHFNKYERISKIVFPYFYSELDAHDSGEI